MGPDGMGWDRICGMGWTQEDGAVTGWMGWRGQEVLLGASSLWPHWGGPASTSCLGPEPSTAPLPGSPSDPCRPRWPALRAPLGTAPQVGSHV